MKTSRFLLMVVAITTTIFSSCERDIEVPVIPEEEILATVKTLAVSDITTTSAVVIGAITSDGKPKATSKGFCWSDKASSPTIKDSVSIVNGGNEEFSDSIRMMPGKLYYVRAFATNAVGVAYGNVIKVTTLGNAPIVETLSVVCTDKSALITAKISSNLLTTTVTVEYGPSNSYGETVNAGTATDTITINVNLPKLNYSTKYCYRIKAENSVGSVTTTGSFTTNTPDMTDVDGNVYKTVKIGDQIWVMENLKVTHYNDGTEIPYVTSDADWLAAGASKTPARCFYNNDPELGKVYGGLYNWYTINTGKLAPKGWHVPTNKEWSKLIVTLVGIVGDYSYGHACREVGTEHWKAPNEGATNVSGFTALPGGSRYITYAGILEFTDLTTDAVWWSSDEDREGITRIIYTSYNIGRMMHDYFLKNYGGLSVRLVKD